MEYRVFCSVQGSLSFTLTFLVNIRQRAGQTIIGYQWLHSDQLYLTKLSFNYLQIRFLKKIGKFIIEMYNRSERKIRKQAIHSGKGREQATGQELFCTFKLKNVKHLNMKISMSTYYFQCNTHLTKLCSSKRREQICDDTKKVLLVCLMQMCKSLYTELFIESTQQEKKPG